MKLVQELIEYLYRQGQLDNADLGFLHTEGFHTLDSPPETQIDDEDASENPEIFDDEQPLSIADIEEQKAAAEDGLSKKGKGRRAFKPEKKWSLEQFNAELLPQIEAWDDTFSPLYRLLMKGNKAEIRHILTAPFIIDEDYIKDTLERVLLYHYGQEPDLARAVLMTDYLETFFVLTKKLSPKNRDRVREWILGKKLVHPEPHREAIFWARQMLDLQIRILKIWRDLTPSVLNHHHKMGYGKPFLAKASEQEEGRLAAQLLMGFIFLHNFDNPTKPETTLLLLLEKQGINDAYQTMAVLFPKEMHDLRERVMDESAFDMPFWLHKLNERHDDTLFLATDLWEFDGHKQATTIAFTNAHNRQKIVLGDIVFDKTWFICHNDYHDLMVSGVFCVQYDEVGVFSEGMAAVRKGDLWGFIDTRGILVIPCQYLKMPLQDLKFTEGVVACNRVIDGRRFSLYLNKSGKDAFPQLGKQLGSQVKFVRPFVEGFAIVCSMDNQWQIINHFGHLLLDEETASSITILSNFSEGFAVFKQKTGELGLINPFGEQFIVENTETESYNSLCPLRENMAAIQNNQGKWGFVDAGCRLVVPCIYDWVWSFSENRAAVCQDGLWGFIDILGHEIIPPQYLMAGHYWNGHAGVLGDTKEWFYINREGQKGLSAYDRINVFSEGEAVVYKKGRMYLRDTKGDERFDYNFQFSNLTEGYFISYDPPSRRKIIRKNQTVVSTIPDIQFVLYFAKGLNLFESERWGMFDSQFRDFEHKPYTVDKNWCISEGFIGVKTEKTDKWTHAFFVDNTKPINQNLEVPFHTIFIQNDLYIIDKKQKTGLKIVCPPDSYVDCEYKTGNRIVIKIGEEAVILRYDLIMEKIWKTKV